MQTATAVLAAASPTGSIAEVVISLAVAAFLVAVLLCIFIDRSL